MGIDKYSRRLQQQVEWRESHSLIGGLTCPNWRINQTIRKLAEKISQKENDYDNLFSNYVKACKILSEPEDRLAEKISQKENDYDNLFSNYVKACKILSEPEDRHQWYNKFRNIFIRKSTEKIKTTPKQQFKIEVVEKISKSRKKNSPDLITSLLSTEDPLAKEIAREVASKIPLNEKQDYINCQKILRLILGGVISIDEKLIKDIKDGKNGGNIIRAVFDDIEKLGDSTNGSYHFNKELPAKYFKLVFILTERKSEIEKISEEVKSLIVRIKEEDLGEQEQNTGNVFAERAKKLADEDFEQLVSAVFTLAFDSDEYKFIINKMGFNFDELKYKINHLDLVKKMKETKIKDWPVDDVDKFCVIINKLIKKNVLDLEGALELIIKAKESYNMKAKESYNMSVDDVLASSITNTKSQENLEQIDLDFPIKDQAIELANSVLKKTQIDTVIGSSNRMKYKEKTDMWVVFANMKNSRVNGKIKWEKVKKEESEEAVWRIGKEDAKYNFSIGGSKMNDEEERQLALFLSNSVNSALLQVVIQASLAYYDRTANCGNRSSLALCHLIELTRKYPGVIKRIEQVQFEDLDHWFLVVNRDPDSELRNPSTWGANAFVMDPWLEDMPEQRMYPADKVVERLKKTRQVLQREAVSLSSKGMTTELLDWWDKKVLSMQDQKEESLPIPQAPALNPTNLPIEVALDVNPKEVGDKIIDFRRITISSTERSPNPLGEQKKLVDDSVILFGQLRDAVTPALDTSDVSLEKIKGLLQNPNFEKDPILTMQILGQLQDHQKEQLVSGLPEAFKRALFLKIQEQEKKFIDLKSRKIIPRSF